MQLDIPWVKYRAEPAVIGHLPVLFFFMFTDLNMWRSTSWLAHACTSLCRCHGIVLGPAGVCCTVHSSELLYKSIPFCQAPLVSQTKNTQYKIFYLIETPPVNKPSGVWCMRRKFCSEPCNALITAGSSTLVLDYLFPVVQPQAWFPQRKEKITSRPLWAATFCCLFPPSPFFKNR